MKISVGPRGILQIDDARIIFRNFSGNATKYNRQGDRNFAVVIPDERIADQLADDGWNVKIRPPREDGDVPFMFLSVKVSFNENGTSPKVYLKSGKARNTLTEETIGCLDDIDIASVDLDIRPYDWNVNGKSGRAAYLHAIHVTQDIDRFADQYAEEEYPDEDY